jgi:hypothetical protein
MTLAINDLFVSRMLTCAVNMLATGMSIKDDSDIRSLFGVPVSSEPLQGRVAPAQHQPSQLAPEVVSATQRARDAFYHDVDNDSCVEESQVC